MKAIIIIFALILLFNILGCVPCSVLLNDTKNLSLTGVVSSKFKDGACFGSIVITTKNGNDTLRNVCYCVPDDEKIWDFVVIGDSLYKSKGSLTIKISRDSLKKEFTFPCCSE
jgi:hypothetical protein